MFLRAESLCCYDLGLSFFPVPLSHCQLCPPHHSTMEPPSDLAFLGTSLSFHPGGERNALMPPRELVLLVFCLQLSSPIRGKENWAAPFQSFLCGCPSFPTLNCCLPSTLKANLSFPLKSSPISIWVSEICQSPFPFCTIQDRTYGREPAAGVTSQPYQATLCCVTSHLQ